MSHSLRTFSALLALLLGGALASPALAQTSIADARSRGNGATVTIEGTVTRALGDFLRLQDASGPTGASALVVRQTSGALHDDIADGTIARGTQLRVTGTLSSFNALLQINEDDISSYDVLDTGPVPDPQEVTLSELSANGEDYESELVRVTGLSLQGASGSFEADETYQVVASATGTEFDFRVQSGDESELGGTATPGGAFDYTGVVGQFDPQGSTSTGYQLIPVRTSDLSPSRSFSFGRPYALAEEGSGLASVSVQAFNLPSGESASVTVQVAATSTASPSADVAGFSGTQTLTFTGPSPAPQVLSFSALADGGSEGVERLEVTLTSSDGVTAAPDRFTLWILDDALAQGPVAEGLEAGPLLDALISTYGNVPTLGYSIARDTMFAVVYGARGDSLRGAYTGFAKFLPADADPTVAACSFDTDGCTDPDDINTEHAWPQSRGSGQEPARSNMHILFPTRADVNSARFTFPYGDVTDAEADEWFIRDEPPRSTPPATNRGAWSRVDDDASRFEPRDAVKGDIARAMFYFATVYPDRANESFFESQKTTIFQWHRDDPVDAAEARRNVLQAAYQGNKLNPFVVDPTLVRRAFGALTPPPGLSATAGETSVQLDWSAPRSGFVSGYNVYRATAPFDAPGAAEQLNDDPLTTTAFTDTEVTIGTQYVYRVSTVDVDGAESDLSDPVDAVSYPSTVEVSFTRPFGSVDAAENYRLVALPGEVDRSLAATVAGEAGDAWQAFWDDGSDTDFLQTYTNSDRFDFRPGRGFWLLSSTSWTVAETFPTVSLTDGTTTIPLHDGWNIISNPFDVDVAWSTVEEANGGMLQPIWAWDGAAFDEAATFTSARQGEAFYFLNQGGLDALTLPYEPASAPASDAQEAAASTTLHLSARADGQDVSRVRLGTAPGASAGRDAHDVVAPPMAFQSTALYALPAGADTAATRRARLALDARASGTVNHTFDLMLHASPGTAIDLRLEPRSAFSDANVILVNLAAGTTYDLRATPSVALTPTHEQTALRVLVGDEAFVAAERENLLPETLRLHPNYPNPFRSSTTLTYDLPNASTVRVSVYDVLGRRVQVLVDERKEAGRHTVRWAGRGASGQPLASGIYFVRLRAGDRQVTRRLTLVR